MRWGKGDRVALAAASWRYAAAPRLTSQVSSLTSRVSPRIPIPTLKITGYGPRGLGAAEQVRPLGSSIPGPTLKPPGMGRSELGAASRSGRWSPLSPALSPLRQGKGDSLAGVAGGVVKVRGGLRSSSREFHVSSLESPTAPLFSFPPVARSHVGTSPMRWGKGRSDGGACGRRREGARRWSLLQSRVASRTSQVSSRESASPAACPSPCPPVAGSQWDSPLTDGRVSTPLATAQQ